MPMTDRERQRLQAERDGAVSAARYLALAVIVLLVVLAYSFGGPCSRYTASLAGSCGVCWPVATSIR